MNNNDNPTWYDIEYMGHDDGANPFARFKVINGNPALHEYLRLGGKLSEWNVNEAISKPGALK